MRSIRTAALAVGAVAMVAALAGCSDSTHGSEGTVKLVEPGGNSGAFGVIGKATQKNISPGNGFAFSSPLQDTAKKTVGELSAFCIATAPSPGESLHGTCSGTATVPGGGFALNVGAKSIAENVSGAIVGGTGKYAGAVGTFSSKSTGGENAPSNLTFDYTLP
jgi:hypothetical protein